MMRRNLARGPLGLALAVCLLVPAAASAYDPAVVTVPWFGDPDLPHQVYSGGPLVLQGVAIDLDTDSGLCISNATWDPGDGSGPLPASGSGLALERTHVYSGAINQLAFRLGVVWIGMGAVIFILFVLDVCDHEATWPGRFMIWLIVLLSLIVGYNFVQRIKNGPKP